MTAFSRVKWGPMEMDVRVRADRPSVIDETFDGEAVLVHLGTGRYYALNAAATEVWELARDGLAVIAVSSELPEVLAIADRVMVLCEGRKTAELVRDEADERTLLSAALPPDRPDEPDVA